MRNLVSLLLLIIVSLASFQSSLAFHPSSTLFNSHLRHRHSRPSSSSSLSSSTTHPNPTLDLTTKQNDRTNIKYQIISSSATSPLAHRLSQTHPSRFTYHPTNWSKFNDGTDNITIGGFQPLNQISGEHVLFLASFHDNDVTLSQFQAMIVLCQSFIKSLTVVLPYYPVGTMERVVKEGTVPTASTYAHMFSSLPTCGCPTRLMVYDLHTLQNRFYLHGNSIASLQTTIPLLKERMEFSDVDCVAFPDDGAAKRFGQYFEDMNLEIVICGKHRGPGSERVVKIQEGNPKGKRVVIIDDLVQTGGTLYECGRVLRAAGAIDVNAFVAHAVFPKESYVRFDRGGDRCCFTKFWVTNSVPTVTEKLPVENGVFEVLDIMERVVEDLDNF